MTVNKIYEDADGSTWSYDEDGFPHYIDIDVIPLEKSKEKINENLDLYNYS